MRGDAALTLPGFGAVAGLSIATHHRRLALGVAHPDIVGGRFHLPVQHGIARQAEDVVDVIGLAPCHHLRAPVVTVTTDGQSGCGPMRTDAAHQAPQMATHFAAQWCLARAAAALPPDARWRCHRHGSAGSSVHHNGGIEQRKLLMAVDDIDGVVDVQRDGGGWTRIAGTVDVNHCV